MKFTLEVFLLPLLTLAACANLADEMPIPDPAVAQEQFERIAALNGSWYGEDGFADPTLIYELTAAGSVVVETVFPGQPHEMRTLFFVEAGTLTLVHYCALGNRPRMVLDDWDASSMHFTLDGDGGLDSPDEMHMHSALFEFTGPDTLRTSWALFDQGQETDSHGNDLARRPAE